MIRTVYRGIGFREAMAVVKNQKYERDERRDFRDGVAAKAVFGSGVYLLSDTESAAQYAFCHAEMENDLAAVLIQKLTLTNPIIINEEYGEGNLRMDAINWKFPKGYSLSFDSNKDSLELIEWMGNIIKDYILHLKCDGIVYYVSEETRYFVSYYPEQQIREIQIDFVFDINQLKESSVQTLRDQYKLENRYN